MRIAYRRMSGAIGVTDEEKGTRGLWWEKRRALVDTLWSHGHQVDYVSRMTKPSAAFAKKFEGPYDILIIEFGSSNKAFYGEDLDETVAMANGHKGKIIFICDDPDLPYLWKTVPKEDYPRWSCWYNAKFHAPFGGQPEGIQTYDMPFSSLQTAHDPTDDYQTDKLAYIGRPKGRERIIKDLIAARVPWKPYAKQKEWDELGMIAGEPPNQPERAEFYRKQLGCIVLADAKHKRLGWRTGRAYHALLAGCPAIVEHDHKALASVFPSFANATAVKIYAEQFKDPERRRMAISQAIDNFALDKDIVVKTMKAFNLW